LYVISQGTEKNKCISERIVGSEEPEGRKKGVTREPGKGKKTSLAMNVRSLKYPR